MKKQDMYVSTIIMAAMAMGLLAYAYYRGDGSHIVGIKSGWAMFIKIAPLLIFAFLLSGLATALLPREAIAHYVGSESGFKGIILGAVAGTITPGGPFVSLPLLAGFMRSGANIGVGVSFITAWSLISFVRLPMEIGIVGWQFTAIRFASVLIFPPIAGLIAQAAFGDWTMAK